MATKFIRKGYCCQCGECCSNRTLLSDENAKKILGATVEVIKQHPHFGKVSRDFEFSFIQNRNTQCKLLEKRKGGKYICRNYENRPPFCKDFPAEPADISNLKYCTYYFEEVKE